MHCFMYYVRLRYIISGVGSVAVVTVNILLSKKPSSLQFHCSTVFGSVYTNEPVLVGL